MSGYLLEFTVFMLLTIIPSYSPIQPPEEEESVFTPTKEAPTPNGDVPAVPAEQLELHPPQPQPRQFHRDDLMLQEKLGEGEYGPMYR